MRGTASRDHGPCRLLPPDSGHGNVYRVYTFAVHGPDVGTMLVLDLPAAGRPLTGRPIESGDEGRYTGCEHLSIDTPG
jgi:hypothetical protein